MDTLTLLEWLRTPCLPEDTEPLPWNLSVSYVSIEKVNEKLRFMEDHFKVIANFYDIRTWAVNTVIPAKDTLWNGEVRIELSGPDFFRSIVGAYTFSTSQYTKNFHYSNSAKSLAIVNAFSSKWEQFGYGLNNSIDGKDTLKEMKKGNQIIDSGSDKFNNTLKSLK